MATNMLIGLLFSAVGVAISYAVFLRNKAKDDRSDGRQDGAILTELGYIKANTDEIKAEQKQQRDKNIEFYSRLAAVESSAKQAHHRIDRLEGDDRP